MTQKLTRLAQKPTGKTCLLASTIETWCSTTFNSDRMSARIAPTQLAAIWSNFTLPLLATHELFALAIWEKLWRFRT